MAISQDNRDFLVQLGYDPSDAKKGLEQSLQDLANYKVRAAQLQSELTQQQTALSTQYTKANRDAIEQRLADVRHEIASTIGAMSRKSDLEKAALKERLSGLRDDLATQSQQLAAFDKQITKVNELKQAYAGLRVQAAQSRAAASVLRPQARSEGGFLEKSLGSLNIGEIFQATGILGLGASLPFAIHDIGKRLKEEVMDIGEYAEKLTLASQKTGMTVNELQKFDAIGKSVGLTTDDMVTAMRKFSEAVVAAGQGAHVGSKGITETAARSGELLKVLGVSVRDVGGNMRSTQEILVQLADGFQRLPDGVTKSDLAVQMFGKSGLNMIPFLNMGSARLKELMADFGGVIPGLEGTAKGFDELRISQAKYEAASEGLKAELAEGLLPLMAKLLDNVAALLGLMNNSGGAFAGFGQFLDRLMGSARYATGQDAANNITTILLGQKGKQAQVDIASYQSLVKTFNDVRRYGVNPAENFHSGKNDLDLYQQAVSEFKRRFPGSAATPSVEQLASLSLISRGMVNVTAAQAAALSPEQKSFQDSIQKILNATGGSRGGTDPVEKAREGLRAAIAAGQAKFSEADLAQILTPEGALKNQIQSAEGQLGALRASASGLTGQALVENLRQQTELTRQLYELKVKLVEADKKDAAALAEVTKRTNEVVDEAEKKRQEEIGRPGSDLSLLLSEMQGKPAPVAGGLPLAQFSSQFEALTAQKEVGALSATDEIARLKEFRKGLQDEITTRLQNNEITGIQLKQLEEMVGLLKQVNAEVSKSAKETPLGEFIKGAKQITDIIGKFSGALGSTGSGGFFGNLGMGVQLLGVSGAGLAELGGGTGSDFTFGNLFGGIKKLLSPQGLLGGGLTSVLGPLSPILGKSALGAGILGGAGIGAVGGALGAGILSFLAPAMFVPIAGPIIAAVAGLGAAIGGILGHGQKNLQKELRDIRKEIDATMNSLRAGTQGIGATIQQLEAERAKAVSQFSGQKGGQKELNQLLPGLDQQIAELKGQQKKIIDDFHKNIAELSIPEDAGRNTIDQIEQIAAALKQARDAGASAAEQMQYLKEAMDNLKVSIGKDLRDEEKSTLDLLQKEIDLEKQRTDIINQAYSQARSIQDSLGLSRAFTPAQSAALRIREINIQRDQQLYQVDQQKQLLDAEIGGQAALFGWSLKDLQSADAKTKLLARQVDLQKQLTALTVMQITANQDFLKSLNAGQIPALPANLLPSGFLFPTGGAYTPTPGAGGGPPGSGTPINIHFNGPVSGNPREYADYMVRALRGINIWRASGVE